MSFDEYRIGGYGDESVQKALGGAGDGKRRSVSPKKRITPPRQTRDPTRTSKSPLSAPSRPHTPNGSPPRHVANELIIDPDLLDAEGESDNAQFISTDKTDLAAEGQNTARQLDKGQQQLLQVQLPGGVPQVDVPHGHSEGLRLQTTNLGVNDSQPPTASSESPSTPAVLGMEGIYANQYDMSRPSSMTDLGSYVAATKGISTNTSSESGYELGGYADPEFDAGQGIPPPRPKKSHARKQPAGHIKRARNAFILFRKHVTDSNLIPTTVEVKHQNISVVAAKMWREAPQEVRQQFQEQARIEKEEHQRKYPGYRYQPVFRRTDIIRRRVRKDVAEDDKVDAVAEALIKGKAGGALEKEIKDQMSQRSEASESEAEGSTRGSSRRRRREAGQLSKGAMRAQRAQARAKQMRQNLFGSNLLNMSMYNAQQAGRSNVMPHHPGAQYAMNESYIPMGYDLEGRPVMPAGFAPQEGMYPPGPAVEGEMYRLPPIDNGMMNVGYDGMGWHDGAVEYWDAVDGQGHQYETHPARGEYYHTQAPAGYDFTDPPPGAGYRLPPLLEGSREGGHTINMGTDRRDDEGVDPRMREWSLDGQQTPSGHVLFNERLFEGALGSAGLQQDRRDEGLVGFDEAIAQVNEVPQW